MGIDLYNHQSVKFSDLGLQLRLPVDSIPSGQYSRHNNVLADIEGQLETRAGCTLAAPVSSSYIQTIFRLNQLQSSPSSTQRLYVSADGAMHYQILPGVTIDLASFTLDGGPASIIDFRFDFDASAWAIIGNSAGMYKVRVRDGGLAVSPTAPYLQWLLGEVPPAVAATATSAGPGALNNGSGPGYDWRYTYVNTTVNTESNPSPIDLAGGGKLLLGRVHSSSTRRAG